MAKNLIPEIAKMLGVEIGEEFKLKFAVPGKRALRANEEEIFCFKEDGIYVVENKEYYGRNDGFLGGVLYGDFEIVKLPWKPRREELFFTFGTSLDDGNRKLRVIADRWVGLISNEARYKAGWVFRTRKEAEAALPEVAKELGVEYEL